MLGGIINRFPNLGRRVVAFERTSRTAIDTLTAIHAHSLRKPGAQPGDYLRIPTSPGEVQRTDALDVLTRPHTAAAQNTFIGVADNRCAARIDISVAAVACELDILHSKLPGK